MGQDDRIDFSRRDRELGPVALPQFLQALKQATIHEHTLPGVFEQILRPCDSACSTHERQVSHRRTISGLRSGPGANLTSMGNVLKRAVLWLAVLSAAVSVSAQSKGLLSVDAIYHPERRVAFSGFPEDNISWLDPATYLVTRQSGSGLEWLKVDAATGRTSPLFDAGRMETVLATLPGVTRAEAGLIARSTDLIFNTARTGAVVTIADDLYFYDIAGTRASRLTSAAGTEEEPTFSPDGKLVAFVRANNLFVVDVATQRERALTTDGGREIFNGKLDWLYQEEIYGRDQFRGYWWSPDSARIAFLQLDERPVPGTRSLITFPIDRCSKSPTIQRLEIPTRW